VLHNFSGFVELLHNVIWQRKFWKKWILGYITRMPRVSQLLL